MARHLRLALILLLGGALAGWVLLVRRLADEPLDDAFLGPVAGAAGDGSAAAGRGAAGAPARHPFEFTSNEECEPCHREIFDEWFADEHSRSWFNRPLLPQDPKRTECSSCHAPRPLLEVGVEAFPVVRAERFHEGVGCIECHANVDHVEGPGPSADAPCNPRQNLSFTRSEICSSCHAPHGTIDEWRSSEWSRRGFTCQGCHMPLVDAPSVTGRPPRRRRSHRMRSQRDPEFLRGAVELEVKAPSGSIVEVHVSNVGAGHNVPGEIFNREMFLATRVLDVEGAVVGEHRESFKTVQREKRASEPSTQLRPKETRVFRYHLAPAHGRVEALLGYKLLLYEPDAAALVVHERAVPF